MDENQNENATSPQAGAYAQLFATALAAGICIGVGVVTGSELTHKALSKVKQIRMARAAKKKTKN